MPFDNDLCRQCNEIFPAQWRGNKTVYRDMFAVAYFEQGSPHSVSHDPALNKLYAGKREYSTIEEAVRALIALEAAWAMGVRQ